MNLGHLLLVTALATTISCSAQPYGGTIFVDPDIITASDSSTFVSVTYTGQGTKTIFDRRVNDWITIEAYLFDVVWNDDLTSEAVINPEFGSVELAEVEAEKYGRSIGRLPHCLRVDVNEIWINKGVELFGGGNFSILIHTGQTVFYENDGILEETLVHEACHTSLDAMHADAPGWLEAQTLDGGFISDYAEEFPDREDIAESFLLWLAVRHRSARISQEDFDLITAAIPNRLSYFDQITCDLFPVSADNITSTEEGLSEPDQMIISPNPTHESFRIHIQAGEMAGGQLFLYDLYGRLIYQWTCPDPNSWKQVFQIKDLPAGFYMLNGQSGNHQFVASLIKQ